MGAEINIDQKTKEINDWAGSQEDITSLSGR